MKRKFWAFSITLVLMVLMLFGPRHPGSGFSPGIPILRIPGSNLTRAYREEPSPIVVGTPLRLRPIWNLNCGEDLGFEAQVNCALNYLNHPGQWMNR
jgi:hypothetical protein